MVKKKMMTSVLSTTFPTLRDPEKFGSNSEETHLISSLIVAQFGGMEGDVRMLKNLSAFGCED